MGRRLHEAPRVSRRPGLKSLKGQREQDKQHICCAKVFFTGEEAPEGPKSLQEPRRGGGSKGQMGQENQHLCCATVCLIFSFPNKGRTLQEAPSVQEARRRGTEGIGNTTKTFVAPRCFAFSFSLSRAGGSRRPQECKGAFTFLAPWRRQAPGGPTSFQKGRRMGGAKGKVGKEKPLLCKGVLIFVYPDKGRRLLKAPRGSRRLGGGGSKLEREQEKQHTCVVPRRFCLILTCPVKRARLQEAPRVQRCF